MGVLTSPKTYTGLAAFQAIDAPSLRGSGAAHQEKPRFGRLPGQRSASIASGQGAAAVGLLSVRWFPGLARLTTAMLTLYFMLAVGAHVRARDKAVNAIPAAALLTTFAVMTFKGPEPSQEP